MSGAAALPRDNGELVFDAPWQGRVLAMALAVVEQRDLDWDEFRRLLIAAIDAHPERPYYDSWTVALTDLVVDLGIVLSAEDLDQQDPGVEKSPEVRGEDRDRPPVEAATHLGRQADPGDGDHDG
jgi:nitrile hydratase accessory protein